MTRIRGGSWLLAVVASLALALGGCKQKPPPTSTGQMTLQKLQQSFPTPTPEQRDNLTKVGFGMRYGQFMQSLSALDALANDPSVNETQKNAINAMIEQIKKQLANVPGQAQQ